LEFYAA